jgi:superoxide dismutase
LATAIDKSFGSSEAFKEQFSKAAAGLFGSGWVWLVKNEDASLFITQESDAGNPLQRRQQALMSCDVWEHAYYAALGIALYGNSAQMARVCMIYAAEEPERSGARRSQMAKNLRKP